MWQTYISSFIIIILSLILFKLANTTSSEEFFVNSVSEKNFKKENDFLSSTGVNQDICNFQHSMEVLLKSLQKEITDNVEDVIKYQLYNVEKKIVARLRYLENKINDIENKLPEKLDDKINPNSKEMDIQKIDRKFDEMFVKLENLQNINIDSSVKLYAINNSTKDCNHALSTLTTSIENQQSPKNCNNTCFDAIKQAMNTNSEILSKINDTTLEMKGTLINILNSTSTINKLNNISHPLIQEPANSETVVSTTTVEQVSTSTQTPPNKSLTDEAEWSWSKCIEERVPDGWSSPAICHSWQQFIHHMSGQPVLRLAVRADNKSVTSIFMSRENPINAQGFSLEIEIWSNAIGVRRMDGVGDRLLIYGAMASPDLSNTKYTRITLSVVDSTFLEMRLGNVSSAAKPTFKLWYPGRLTELRYFGFSTRSNEQGFATFKYGC